MLHIKIMAIGKKKMAHDVEEWIADYTQRIKRYAYIDWSYIATNVTTKNIIQTKEIESNSIMNKLAEKDMVVLLDEQGKQYDSIKFATFLSGLQDKANKSLIFIIGGAYGVSDQLKKRANYIWSLSHLVFPHLLVRCILAEQLYRAFTIIENEPYHHK